MKFPRKIYAIKHNITNRVYVGSSSDVEQRLKNHIFALRAHRHVVEDMQVDFDRYGEDYTFTILDEIDGIEGNVKEYEWMKKYQSHLRGKGYNYKDHLTRPRRVVPKYMLTFAGKTMSIGDWSREVNIPYEVIYGRIYARNWDVEKALTTPKGKRGAAYDRN